MHTSLNPGHRFVSRPTGFLSVLLLVLLVAVPVQAQEADSGDEDSAADSESGQDRRADSASTNAAGEDSTTLRRITVSGGNNEGYAPQRSQTGLKADIPLRETPQSVSVVTREQMEDRDVDSLTEAVSYTPGMRVGDDASRAVIDSFNLELRGFSAENATFRDGTQLQAGLPYDAPLETFGLERVEILRGPSSVLYGQGQPGGVVNLVTKKPTREPLRELGLEVGSHDHKQFTADFSNAITEDGNWRYRLTGLVQDSDSHIDYVMQDRTYVAPSLTWEPRAGTSLTLLSHYQKNETRYPWSAFPREGTKEASQFGRIPDSRYIGEPSFDGYDSTESVLGYIFEHTAGRWTFRQNVRYREVDYDVQDTFRDYYAAAPGPLQPDLRTLERARRARYDKGSTLTADNRVISDWTIGVVDHTFMVGVDYKTLDYDSRDSGFANPVDPIDLYDPVYNDDPFQSSLSFSESGTEADQTGYYLQEHARVGEHWAFTLGARRDEVSEDPDNGESNSQDALSKRAGVVYMMGAWAPYVNYSESFTPQYGRNNAGEKYDPITGEQMELGLRYQPDGSAISATAALFNITKQNEVVADPDQPSVQRQLGETRSRGMELGLNSEFTRSLKARASYTYQNVEHVEAGAGSQDIEGNRLPDKPKHLANAWLDYTIQGGDLDGLGLGLGVRYTGTTYADDANEVENPASTKMDAAIRYAWEKAEVQVSATNLLDEQEVYCGGESPSSFCTYGVPRYVKASLKYNF